MITPQTTLSDLALRLAAFALSANCSLLPNGRFRVELTDNQGYFAEATSDSSAGLAEAFSEAFSRYVALMRKVVAMKTVRR